MGDKTLLNNKMANFCDTCVPLYNTNDGNLFFKIVFESKYELVMA